MLDKLTQFTGGLQERLQTYGLAREVVSRVVKSRQGVRESAAASGSYILLQTEGQEVQGKEAARVVELTESPAEEQPAIANFKLPNDEPDIPVATEEVPVTDATTQRLKAARDLIKEQFPDAA